MQVEKAHPFFGWLCIALGLLPIVFMTGAHDFAQQEANAPDWVIIISGMIFVLGGLMILAGQQSQFTTFCAGLLCACFGLLAAWIALAAPGEGFSGGIPFVPREFNIILSRWVFGIGAVISFLISNFAFRQYARGRQGSRMKQ